MHNSIANKRGAIGSHQTDVRILALRGAAIAVCILGIFELLKMALYPNITIWASHLVTILVAALLVSIASYSALKKQERLRREIAVSEDRYRLLFESSLAGAYRTTLDGTILDCNASFCRMFGYESREELIGHPINVGYFSISDRVQFIERLSTEKSATNFEQRLRRKDGSAIWVLNSAILSTREDGMEPVIKGTVTDISDLRKAEQEHRRLAAIVRCSDDAIISCTTQGEIETWNAGAARIFGYSAEEVIGKRLDILAPGDRPDEYLQILERIKSGQEAGDIETVRRRNNGQPIMIALSVSPITDAAGEVIGAAAIARDITDRKQAEEKLLFKTALLEAQSETTIEGILVVDESHHIILANQQFALHFRVPDDLLLAKDDRLVLQHVTDKVEDSDAFLERIKYLYSHPDEKSSDEFRLRNGKTFERYSAPLVDANGHRRGRIWYFRDITDRKAAEERIQFLAYFDALTGLPNRSLLKDRLLRALAGARRRGDKVALLSLDLDRFKLVNDSLGHAIGDLLLKDVAERLKRCTREQDTVAKVNGDEFVIVLSGVKDEAEAAVAAARITDAVAGRFSVQGHSLSTSCSVGISIFPEHSDDCDTLIRYADQAMYRAKENGRNRFQFFNEDMNVRVMERLGLENDLRLALERDEFFLAYQPQMGITTGEVTGIEALIRWQHPTLGLVPPNEFIAIAENGGLILPIGEWVLRTACAQAQKWHREGFLTFPIAVNVSAVQFRQEGFCQLIRIVLHETGLPPQFLELELTETLLLSNADVMFAVLQELKELGVLLAIDDFGTGYSSLSYLKQFRVNKLKIDRSFIRDIAFDSDDAAITTAIISLARSLNLKVVAEGVENEAQMSFLRTHRCDEIQGYYFSKPVTAVELAENILLVPVGRRNASIPGRPVAIARPILRSRAH
jgi:diguanylate cyclase (GGDEF)-like protein/PAS domain S-box-containing protein